MNKFDEYCFKFKNLIVQIFNEENNIPFLMKYYLFKDVWEEIQKVKNKNDYNMMEAQRHATEEASIQKTMDAATEQESEQLVEEQNS